MSEPANLTMRDRVAMLRLPATTEATGSGQRVPWLPWTLCLLSAFAALSLATRKGNSAPAESPQTVASRDAAAPKPSPSPDTLPTSASPAIATGATVLESKGYIIPAHQIQVSPIEVSGQILELNIEEGKLFRKGEVLAVLDRSSFEAQLMEAKANLVASQARLTELKNGSRPEEIQQAAAELREAEESLKQAKLKFERNKIIASGALSAEEFEQAQYAYTSLVQKVARLERSLRLAELGPRQERIDVAAAEVKLAEARLKRAQWQFDNCILRAPITGIILKKSAEIGGLVSPLSFNVAASVCEMADLNDLEVDLEIPERDISKVIKGMPCSISTDAYPTRFYKGVVDRIMPTALQNKAAVQVRVKVEVPPGEEQGAFLKPGMNARVTFLQPSR
ncbi:MAG: efflux RND transporter periplasmic adaptor subunit [Gemmataceae bacterium]|nr:efflux RND transporter periplasmic adaptor subunit [Gemmataceae bacterium]